MFVGLGVGVGRQGFGGGIDAQAQAHYNRVIADGGVVPAGVSGTNAFFNAVKSIYGTSDITTAVSVGVDAHYLGYKMGEGAGATSGQAVQKLYSCAGSSGDVVQTTAASQPLLLAHNGASTDNYWWGSGVSGNYVQTPNANANNITGDIEIIWNYIPQNIGVVSNVAVKFNGSQYCYKAVQFSSQRLQFETKYGTSTSTNHGVTSGTNIWFKITRTSSNGYVTFYKSTDGVTYTLISQDTTKAAGALATGGTLDVTNGDPQVAKYYRITISNSIDGTPVVDFNPATYNASTSQTQWTSSTGEVWTINTGTATTGYKGVLVDRTIVQGDGVDDTLAATIAISGIKSAYWAITRLANATKSVSDALVANRFNLYSDAATGLSIYTNTGNLASSGLTRNILSQFAVVNNGASSTISKNDGVKTTGTLNNNTLTGIKLFNGADGFSNFHINTHIITSIADSNAQQTAMYNYIRSINNNAF